MFDYLIVLLPGRGYNNMTSSDSGAGSSGEGGGGGGEELSPTTTVYLFNLGNTRIV